MSSAIFGISALCGCSAGSNSGRIKEEVESESGKKRSAQASVLERETSEKMDEREKARLVASGRALEAGDIDKASSLLQGLNELPEASLLLAKIAVAKGDYEDAVRRYHALTDKQPGFETARITALAEALARAGRPYEAASTIKNLLDSDSDLQKSVRLELMVKRASWILESGRAEEAVLAFEEAGKVAAGGKARDRIVLNLGRALIAAGELDKARSVLLPLALNAAQASTMEDALKELKKSNAAPAWNAAELLGRARALISLRSFDAALSTLEPLLKDDAQNAIGQEARFLVARTLFESRGRYKEALDKLHHIAKTDKEHAEEAEFLIARALSRLDRDDEAIKKYSDFARKTKKPAKAAEARFLAARLEFYLGKHQAALGTFERLVGNGKRDDQHCLLNDDDKREAHFLAGMSALLLKKASRAEPHFAAGSRGSNSAELLARNRYWTAVARSESNVKKGMEALSGLCSEDPTSWYARLAARRIEEMKGDLGPCRLPDVEPGENTGGAQSLENLSSLAAFYARAGLFSEAALELKRVEDSNRVKASTRDWVANYMSLDAPGYSIQRASAGLEWPPKKEEWWLARAAYPTPYRDLVDEVEKKHALPGKLIYAVARKESLFKPDAVSSVGAMGMMQMMPRTFEKARKRAGLSPLKQGELPGPEQSIIAAGFEFAELIERFGGSIPLVLMAYNGGAGAVSRWLERSGGLPIDVFVEKAGFAQTRNYVKRVFQNLVRYRMLAGEPLPDLPNVAEVPRKNKLEESDDFEKPDSGLYAD